MNLLSLREKIKICSIIKGYTTMFEFCKKIGLSESYLSLIINGKRKISIKTANNMIKNTKDCGEYAITIEDVATSLVQQHYNNKKEIRHALKVAEDTSTEHQLPDCQEAGDE